MAGGTSLGENAGWAPTAASESGREEGGEQEKQGIGFRPRVGT